MVKMQGKTADSLTVLAKDRIGGILHLDKKVPLKIIGHELGAIRAGTAALSPCYTWNYQQEANNKKELSRKQIANPSPSILIRHCALIWPNLAMLTNYYAARSGNTD